MSQAENNEQQEPTMEEILASIRRIISEDEQGETDGDGAAVDETAETVEEVAATDELETADLESPDPEPVAEDVAPAEDIAETIDQDDDDVLELTEVVEEEEPPLTADTDDDFDDDEIDVFDTVPPPPAPHPEANNADHRLISDNPASQASSKFAQYSDALAMTRGIPIGNPNKSLEDVVKELLRPMLREWLDENLPPLVERLVEREINKIAGQGEKD